MCSYSKQRESVMNIQEAFDKHVANTPKLDAGMFLRGEKDCLNGVAHEDG